MPRLSSDVRSDRYGSALHRALLRGHLVALAVVGLTVACGAPPPSAPFEMPPVPVELVALEPQPVEQIGEFLGTIKSRRSTTIQPQAEGFITRILVSSGARVGPGTALFEIDATTQRAAVASLEAQQASREADVTYARQQAERTRSLLEVDAVSQQEYEQAATQQKTAEAQLQSVEDQIQQQQAELDYHRVATPTRGVVGDVPVRVGDRVTRSTVLMTLEDNAALEVYINVPVQDVVRLKLGLPLRIVSDAGETLGTSELSFVASSVDDATQTVLVKAPVAAGGVALLADQFMRVQIVWNTEPRLMLPVVAVQRINNQYFAFVAEDVDGGLIARQRSVTLGPIAGSSYTVLAGLDAGDRLVLAGTQKIGDGAPVQPLPTGPAPGATEAPPAGRGGA